MAASRSGSGRGSKPGGGLEKPDKGVCSKCRSDDLYFYDDGRGECLECGHRFWWDKGPKAQIPASQVDRRRRPSQGRGSDDDMDDERGRDRRERPRRDRDRRPPDDGGDDRDYVPPGRRATQRSRGGRARYDHGEDDFEDGPEDTGPPGTSPSMDWEEDFDTDDDEFGDEDPDDDGRGEGSKKKGKRFEIKIGQPTVTGVEKDGGDAAFVEPLPDSMAVSTEIPKEFRDRVRALENQMSEVTERLDGLKTAVEALDGRLTAIDATMDKQSALIDEMDGVRQDFVKVEATVNELSAIYDLVSAQINPFIDMGSYPSKDGGGAIDETEVDWDMEQEEEVPGSGVKNPFVDEDMGSSEGGSEGEEEVAMPPLMDEPLPEGGEGGAAGSGGTGGGGKSSSHPLDIKKIQRLGPQKWLLRWTDFLLTKVEPRDLPLLLNYYKELGWIDERMEEKVMSYLTGVKGVKKRKAAGAGGEPDTLVGEDGFAVPDMDSWKLTMEDHSRSLEFLEFIRNESLGQAPRPAEAAAAGLATR